VTSTQIMTAAPSASGERVCMAAVGGGLFPKRTRATEPGVRDEMSQSRYREHVLPLLGAAALAIGPAQSSADTPPSNGWQYAASVYMWAPGIKVTTAAGSDVDIGFDTLISNLNMVFMGAFEARKSKWSALADALYLNVGANEGGKVAVTGPLGATRRLKVDTSVKVRSWVLTFLGGYNLVDDEKLFLDVVAGVRYLEMKTEFALGLRGRPFGRPIDVAALGAGWDGVIGVRGRANLEGNWYLPFHLDVGTGDSNLTWQAIGGVGYRFDWGDLSLAYRYLEWDFESDSKLDDLNISGPQLTATFHW